MATIFELWAECRDRESTERLAQHFNGVSHTLLDGCLVEWISEVTDRTGILGVCVWSPALSSMGVRTVEDALRTSEAGLHLYHHLKGGPDFCFARVAWEAEILTSLELPDFVETLSTGDKSLSLQYAVNEDVYRKLGSPVGIFPFRDGYRWTRYRGEQYQPLYSNDQVNLNARCRELFPEYFKY